MKKILFLDNAVADDTYNAAQYWKPLLVHPYDMFRVALGEWPSDVSAYSHILITGSSACILDNADWFPNTAKLIRTAGFVQVDFIGAGPVNSYTWCTSIFFPALRDCPWK
jgi:hypothetical protein